MVADVATHVVTRAYEHGPVARECLGYYCTVCFEVSARAGFSLLSDVLESTRGKSVEDEATGTRSDQIGL
jgi:hypothetical protein